MEKTQKSIIQRHMNARVLIAHEVKSPGCFFMDFIFIFSVCHTLGN